MSTDTLPTLGPPQVPTGWDPNYLEPTDEEGVYKWAGVRPDDGEPWRRYSVVMELMLDADSAKDASDRAMEWRDAIGMGGWNGEGRDKALEQLDPDLRWHLHHPLGC